MASRYLERNSYASVRVSKSHPPTDLDFTMVQAGIKANICWLPLRTSGEKLKCFFGGFHWTDWSCQVKIDCQQN